MFHYIWAANISKSDQLTLNQCRWINRTTGEKHVFLIWWWKDPSRLRCAQTCLVYLWNASLKSHVTSVVFYRRTGFVCVYSTRVSCLFKAYECSNCRLHNIKWREKKELINLMHPGCLLPRHYSRDQWISFKTTHLFSKCTILSF